MSSATLALVVAAAAVVVTIAVAVLVVRGRRASDRRIGAELYAMSERLDSLSLQLAGTVTRVREDAERARLVESLSQALDRDEVAARCAEAAVRLPDVAAAIVQIELNGSPLVATAGLGPAAQESLRAAGIPGGPPDGRRVRAVGVSYHYLAADDSGDALRSAIAVPLESEDGCLGFLTVFGLSEDPPVAGAEFQTLEAIARHAGPALARAPGQSEPRPVPVDRLTALGTRQGFHETLAVDVARAKRRGERLAVCVLDVDDFRAANEQRRSGHGRCAARRDRGSAARRPSLPDRRGRVRRDPARVRPDRGRSHVARLQASLRRRPLAPGPALSLSAGIAELKPDDDGVSLFERAERALHRAKEAGKGTAA